MGGVISVSSEDEIIDLKHERKQRKAIDGKREAAHVTTREVDTKDFLVRSLTLSVSLCVSRPLTV